MRYSILLAVCPALFAQSVMMTIAPPPFNFPAITGAPYSADQNSQMMQTLSDGTHLTRSNVDSKTYRDFQGRTRTERPLFIAPQTKTPDLRKLIEIRDPQAAVQYTLDPENHIAHRFALAKAALPAVPPANPIPPAERPQSTMEKLPSQFMEGINVTGTRTTMVYAIGSQGNDRPITVTTETWFSPDLKITVLMKMSDPRMGDNTMKLTNISRAEPDPTLFQVPPGYKIIDETGPFTISVQPR